MSDRFLVLNGPNLNLLGVRQPEVYGTATLADLEQRCRMAAQELGCEVAFSQSNHEGVLIDAIHAARHDCTGIVVNAGGFSHTSVAIRDALSSADLPVAEVHLSNVFGREEFRSHSYISAVACCVIAGAGFSGYEYALRHLAEGALAGA